MFVARDGLLVEIESPGPTETDAPEMPIFLERDSDRHDYGTRDLRAGFTLELSVRLESLDAGLVLLDNRMENGKGFCVRIARHGTLERSEVAQPAAQQRSFYCEIRIMNQCDEISLSDEQRDECLTRLNEDGFVGRT